MRNNAYDFAIEVDRQIKELSNKDFHLRNGKAKRLREELYPIARLALHYKQPGLEIEVEAFENSGEVDGHLVARGFNNYQFNIEVTFVHTHEDALRSELMVNRGVAPCTGPIHRNGRLGPIVATHSPVNYYDEYDSLAAMIVELFNNKIAKSYPPKTVLIIAFEELKFRGYEMWTNLLTKINHRVQLNSSSFQSVYLLNCTSNELNQTLTSPASVDSMTTNPIAEVLPTLVP